MGFILNEEKPNDDDEEEQPQEEEEEENNWFEAQLVEFGVVEEQDTNTMMNWCIQDWVVWVMSD